VVRQTALEETKATNHAMTAVNISSGIPWDYNLFAIIVSSFFPLIYIYLFKFLWHILNYT
jgi:hypothetical protein